MRRLSYFLGLSKDLQIHLNYGKADFIELIGKEIKPGQLFFFDQFDANRKKYYGKIDQNNFAVRRSQKIIPHSPFSSATGRITGGSDSTALDITLVGWNWFVLTYMAVFFLIFGLALKDIIANNSYIILILLIPMFLIFIIMPTFTLKKGLKKFEQYLLSDIKRLEE